MRGCNRGYRNIPPPTYPDGYVVVQCQVGNNHPVKVSPFVAAWFMSKGDALTFHARYKDDTSHKHYLAPTRELADLLEYLAVTGGEEESCWDEVR